MSTLLESVVANFLDSVSEREVDAPLMGVLRSRGFRDIHLIHGQYEFGKDIIAKSGGEQYAFQSKAGNLKLAEWNAVLPQVEMLRDSELAHPNFDTQLPRRAVLALTGRLAGGATLEAQDYRKRTSENRTPFEIWDRDDLVGMFKEALATTLGEGADGPLLEIVGRIDGGSVSEPEIEDYSRRWVARETGAGAWSSFVEAALLASRLEQRDRLDLACFTCLCLVRGVWAATHGDVDEQASVEEAELARRMFELYAVRVWAGCSDELLDSRALLELHRDGLFFDYPVRCCRIAEIVGLFGLAANEDDQRGVAAWLTRFIAQQPGTAHPVSDRWATSIVPAALLVGRNSPDVVREYLTELTRWIGQRYEDGELGLAYEHARPEAEIEHLAGGALEHVRRARRDRSYLATILLDLASVLELGEEYDVAYNDIRAVDARPALAVPDDNIAQYLVAGDGVDVPIELSPRYVESWEERDGWCAAPHHRVSPDKYRLGRLGRWWDQLAVMIVTRDRHWVRSMRAGAGREDGSPVDGV